MTDPIFESHVHTDDDNDALAYFVLFLGAQHIYAWIKLKHIKLYTKERNVATLMTKNIDHKNNTGKARKRKKVTFSGSKCSDTD